MIFLTGDSFRKAFLGLFVVSQGLGIYYFYCLAVEAGNTLSLVSFAGMTLDKCIVLRIGTLTGCPLCRESHPLCRLKNPTVISIWLLVGFHPATGVYNVHLPIMLESERQAVYRERKGNILLSSPRGQFFSDNFKNNDFTIFQWVCLDQCHETLDYKYSIWRMHR